MTRQNRQSMILAAILALGTGPAMADAPQWGFACNSTRYPATACGVRRCLNDLWGNFYAELRNDALGSRANLAATGATVTGEARRARNALFGAVNVLQEAQRDFRHEANVAQQRINELSLAEEPDVATINTLSAQKDARTKAADCLETYRNNALGLADDIGESDQEGRLSHQANRTYEIGTENGRNDALDHRYDLWANAKGALAGERGIVRNIATYQGIAENGIESQRCVTQGQGDVNARLQQVKAEVVGGYREALGQLEAPWGQRQGHRLSEPPVSETTQRNWQAFFDASELHRSYWGIPFPMEAHRAQAAYTQALGVAGEPLGEGGMNYVGATKQLLDATYHANRARSDWGRWAREMCD